MCAACTELMVEAVQIACPTCTISSPLSEEMVDSVNHKTCGVQCPYCRELIESTDIAWQIILIYGRSEAKYEN